MSADTSRQAGISLSPRLSRALDHVIARSPAGAVSQSSIEQSSLRAPLVSDLESRLTRFMASDLDQEALALAIHEVFELQNQERGGARGEESSGEESSGEEREAAETRAETSYGLTEMFSGPIEALDALAEQVVSGYLARRPWGALSERSIRELCYGWREALGSGDGVNLEQLWVDGASVTLAGWLDVGLHALLERVWAQVIEAQKTTSPTSSMSHPTLIGIRISGSGESAHLAYLLRWCLSRGVETRWITRERDRLITPHEPIDHPEQLSALLIDDLHLSSRQLQWRLASALTRAKSEPAVTLCAWADGGVEGGLGSSLAVEVDHLFTLDLDVAWREHDSEVVAEEIITAIDEVTDERPRAHPSWARRAHPHLTYADHLRLCDIAHTLPPHEPRFEIGDMDAYAALLGPLCPVEVLAEAAELPLDSTREILRGAGWVEVDEHPELGARFAPPTQLFWRAALIDGGARAHRAAPLLITALERRCSGEARPLVRAQLKRLERLRGRADYAQLEEPLDPQLAHETLETLKGALTAQHPSRLALMTLCGLALDWSTLGPAIGRWDAALHALELGVASARRLGDHRGVGRLLLKLGKLALDDGRAAIAEGSLEVATTILSALKTPDASREARLASSLWAEARVLQGDIAGASQHLIELERESISSQRLADAWQSRFRAGQLWAQLGEHQRALDLWLTLSPDEVATRLKPRSVSQADDLEEARDAQSDDRVESSEQDKLSDTATSIQQSPRALTALATECANSLLHLNRSEEAWDLIESRGDRSWLTRALTAICHWRSRGEDPLPALERCLNHTREARDIGAWVALQRWRAHATLEVIGRTDSASQEESQDAKQREMQTLSAARVGLELAVRVMTGARDRLQLIALYQQLASLYRAQSQEAASDAALAMADAWRATLTLPPELNAEPDLSREDSQAAELASDASAEVSALIEGWRVTPMSASISSASS